MNDLIHELSKTHDFRILSKQSIKELIGLGRSKTIPKGGFLCMQDDIWPYMIYLRKGQLRWVILSMGGKEHVLFYVEPKQTFWGHTLMDGHPMPASLTASKQSEVMIWHKDVLHPFLNRNPELLWSIISYQTRVMRRAREIIYGLAFKPVAGRLAKLLLERTGPSLDEPIRRDLTLNEIATLINSSQEVVCRILYQFQEDGLLKLSRATIQLQDLEALQKISEVD